MQYVDDLSVSLSWKPGRYLEAVFLLVAFSIVPTVSRGQNAPAPAAAPAKPTTEKQDAAVRAHMRNVNYRFTDNVAVHIKWLNGALIPVGSHEFPVLDDKNSFHIRVDTAEIAVMPDDLSNILNSYVFARPHAPLVGISVVISNGQIKIKGKLHDKGDIPFESIATLSPTPDGKVRVHSDKIKALHVPMKGLMNAFGVEVDDLIKTGKVPGVEAEENDLILDLGQILPPPHIEGKVTAIRIEGNAIVENFGTEEKKPAAEAPERKLRVAPRQSAPHWKIDDDRYGHHPQRSGSGRSAGLVSGSLQRAARRGVHKNCADLPSARLCKRLRQTG